MLIWFIRSLRLSNSWGIFLSLRILIISILFEFQSIIRQGCEIRRRKLLLLDFQTSKNNSWYNNPNFVTIFQFLLPKTKEFLFYSMFCWICWLSWKSYFSAAKKHLLNRLAEDTTNFDDCHFLHDGILLLARCSCCLNDVLVLFHCLNKAIPLGSSHPLRKYHFHLLHLHRHLLDYYCRQLHHLVASLATDVWCCCQILHHYSVLIY